MNSLFKFLGVLLGFSLAQTTHAAGFLYPERVKAADVIFIVDEDHGAPEMLAKEIFLLSQLKELSPEFNCLFLEAGRSATLPIRNFLNGAAYENSVLPWIRKNEQRLGLTWQNVIPPSYLKEAFALGFALHGADYDADMPVGKKIDAAVREFIALSTANPRNATPLRIRKLTHDKRNQIFAESIATEFRAKHCNKAVLIVGGAHLFDAPGVRSIDAYLSRLKIKSFTAYYL